MSRMIKLGLSIDDDDMGLAAEDPQPFSDTIVHVKMAIDDMLNQLTAEKQDEDKHKDWCVAEINTNQVQTEGKEVEKQDVWALIEDLQLQINTLTRESDILKSEIDEFDLDMKHGGEDREMENKEFSSSRERFAVTTWPSGWWRPRIGALMT